MNHDNKTIVIESQFMYDYYNPENGITVGGTQRYAIELAKLFKSMGWNVIIATKASKATTQKNDIYTIKSFPAPYGIIGTKKFSKIIYDYCNSLNPNVVCYSDISLTYYYLYKNSFALQHGIGWDNPTKKMKALIQKRTYKKILPKLNKIICVDTNFINWCRDNFTYYFNNPEKLVYVPNFADEKIFQYKPSIYSKDSMKTILYPRRLVLHRGYDLYMDACEMLINEGYNIKPVLAFDEKDNNKFCKLYNNKLTNASIVNPSMSDINKLYYESFLSIIPSKWSEGTSLSAIESLSCGCPVVGTYVGGLANIIIPGFNGELVAPNAQVLANAIKKLLENVDLRNRYASNCKNINMVFGKKMWRKRITEAINSLL